LNEKIRIFITSTSLCEVGFETVIELLRRNVHTEFRWFRCTESQRSSGFGESGVKFLQAIPSEHLRVGTGAFMKRRERRTVFHFYPGPAGENR
jgi:hypothetical protein